MRKTFLLAIATIVGLGADRLLAQATPPAQRPNIILILSDDHGIDGVGCYGSDRFKGKTPHIDALASSGDLQFVEFCARRRDELRASVKPPRLLGGTDLIAMGFTPGPALGETLRALETAQLEGEIGTRDEAVAWIRARMG